MKGVDYLKDKEYEKADSVLSFIEKDKFLEKKILFERANLNFVMGKLNIAKRFYTIVYQKYNDISALYNLSVTLRKLSHDSTVYYYRLYLEKSEGISEYYFAKKRLAYLYMDMGKFEEAKNLLDDIYGLSPSSFEEKELKFFYMHILRALLDFESAMREGAMIYNNYPYDELFSKTALEEAFELAKILKFNLKDYLNFIKK